MNERTYFKIVHPSGCFSDMYADTLEEARIKLNKWGECPNGTPENKIYWLSKQAELYIVKVVETTKIVK